MSILPFESIKIKFPSLFYDGRRKTFWSGFFPNQRPWRREYWDLILKINSLRVQRIGHRLSRFELKTWIPSVLNLNEKLYGFSKKRLIGGFLYISPVTISPIPQVESFFFPSYTLSNKSVSSNINRNCCSNGDVKKKDLSFKHIWGVISFPQLSQTKVLSLDPKYSLHDLQKKWNLTSLLSKNILAKKYRVGTMHPGTIKFNNWRRSDSAVLVILCLT